MRHLLLVVIARPIRMNVKVASTVFVGVDEVSSVIQDRISHVSFLKIDIIKNSLDS